MDNFAIARILQETADLLEIKSDNPFKIRAYRHGADIAANHPHQLASLEAAQLREIPGIGKDLAARIREIAETGDAASGAATSLMDDVVRYRPVERVLAGVDTKSSVLIRGGFQADLRLVTPECRGAALQYFIGWGVIVARRAWLEPRHVLNTRPFEEFRAALRRHCRRSS